MCSSPATNQGYILIVEDCADQRNLLRHILEKSHYRVAVANNGIEAIARMREEKPRLVISDVSMPEMGGFDLCRAVKSQGADIPVILVTALWDVKNLLQGLAAGADYYLLKPLNRATLVARTAEILKGTGDTQNVADAEPCLMYQFDGEDHAIPHSRRQILKLLISHHESTIHEKRKSLADYRENSVG